MGLAASDVPVALGGLRVQSRRMSRYTPKQRPLAAGGGPARPKKKTAKRGPTPRINKKKGKAHIPTPFACPTCGKAYRTEEALVTHKLDAHGAAPDISKLSPLTPSMVRCPKCGAPVGKRNLAAHLRMVHGSDDGATN